MKVASKDKCYKNKYDTISKIQKRFIIICKCYKSVKHFRRKHLFIDKEMLYQGMCSTVVYVSKL